ncbi:MAG: thioredoxin-dependent thiol peroxidase [Candidatus Aenigmatarchaeota archaeon]|nr:thioredoxin-dependent thiol peroxidase [Candidatus Aenigmarchaeota archaeon]
MKVGDPVPDIKVKDMNGKDINLKDFKGKKLVVYFYPKDDTPGCTVEACSFRDNNEKIEKMGAKVIGISADSIDSHKKFSSKHKLSFMLLSDSEHKLAEAFGVWKQKSFMGKKFFGIERSTFIIDEKGKIAYIFQKVKPQGHAEEVIKVLESL